MHSSNPPARRAIQKRTPLIRAAYNGHVTCVRLLLADGASKRPTANDGGVIGRTALGWAEHQASDYKEGSERSRNCKACAAILR